MRANSQQNPNIFKNNILEGGSNRQQNINNQMPLINNQNAHQSLKKDQEFCKRVEINENDKVYFQSKVSLVSIEEDDNLDIGQQLNKEIKVNNMLNKVKENLLERIIVIETFNKKLTFTDSYSLEVKESQIENNLPQNFALKPENDQLILQCKQEENSNNIQTAFQQQQQFQQEKYLIESQYKTQIEELQKQSKTIIEEQEKHIQAIIETYQKQISEIISSYESRLLLKQQDLNPKLFEESFKAQLESQKNQIEKLQSVLTQERECKEEIQQQVKLYAQLNASLRDQLVFQLNNHQFQSIASAGTAASSNSDSTIHSFKPPQTANQYNFFPNDTQEQEGEEDAEQNSEYTEEAHLEQSGNEQQNKIIKIKKIKKPNKEKREKELSRLLKDNGNVNIVSNMTNSNHNSHIPHNIMNGSINHINNNINNNNSNMINSNMIIGNNNPGNNMMNGNINNINNMMNGNLSTNSNKSNGNNNKTNGNNNNNNNLNCVPLNFINSFSKFLHNPKEIKMFDNIKTKEQFEQMRKSFNNLVAQNDCDDQFIKNIIQSPPYSPTFFYFLKNRALDWIHSSNLLEKERYLEALNIYISYFQPQMAFSKLLKRD